MMNSRPSSASRKARTTAGSLYSLILVRAASAMKASTSAGLKGPRQLSYQSRKAAYRAKATSHTHLAPTIICPLVRIEQAAHPAGRLMAL